MKKSKLIQNIIYNGIYQIFIMFIPLITTPYISRVFTVSQIGINGYTLSIIQIFILLSFYGLNNYGSREIAATKQKEDINKQFWSLWIVQLVFTLLSFSILLILNFYIFNEYKLYLFIQSFLVLINGLEISWFFVGIEELKKVVIRNSLLKIVSTILIFMLVKNPDDFILYLLINIFSTCIGNIVFIFSLKQYISNIIFDLNKIKEHVKKSGIFLLPQFSILIYTTLDKSILGYLSTVEQVGYYDQCQKIVRVAIAIVSSIGLVLMPRMTLYVKNKNWDKFEELFSISINYIFIISFYVITMIICLSASFVPWFFGLNYIDIIPLMRITSIIGVFIPIATLLWNTILIPLREDKIAIKSAIYAAIISIMLNILLDKRFGALGAVIALCCAEFFGFMYRVYYANKYYNLKRYMINFAKYLVICIIVCLIFFSIKFTQISSFKITIIQAIIVSIIYGIVLLIVRDPIILNLIGKIKLKNIIKR